MTSFKQFRQEFSPSQAVHFNAMPSRARNIQGLPAGFTSRFIAVLIDIAMIALLLVGTYGLWLGLRYILSVFYDIPPISGLPLLLVGYFLMWAYWTWSWASGGRSLGNVLMGLRVQTRSGGTLSIGQAAGRALFSVVFPVGLAWSIISRSNLSVQDIVMRTEVVFNWAPLVSNDDS